MKRWMKWIASYLLASWLVHLALGVKVLRGMALIALCQWAYLVVLEGIARFRSVPSSEGDDGGGPEVGPCVVLRRPETKRFEWRN